MHIKRLIVRNFRNIGFADVHFGEKLNVLVGRNGSGKSNLLAALRLVADSNLGRQARMLHEDDFYQKCGPRAATQVLIAAEFGGFDETLDDKQERLKLCGGAESAWVTYRFRPGIEALTAMANKTKLPEQLRLEDYESERTYGGRESPFEWSWDSPGGTPIEDDRLRNYVISEIPAIRDVVQDLRRVRSSPLTELLESLEISKADQDNVETAFEAAHAQIGKTEPFEILAKLIADSYRRLSGEVQGLTLRLGLAPPDFLSLVRQLGLIVSDDLLKDFELSRNGLGYNNLLYIAMLMENFRRLKESGKGSQLLLIEEPEAHLHPQAQEALTRSFIGEPFQTIVTTHSPHVVVAAGLRSVICFDRAATAKGQNLASSSKLTCHDIEDLERYLNADRGALLFATKVILVEGSAEQILVPRYADVMGINLSRLGIQICAVNGTHFAAFRKLLGDDGVDRRHVIIRDGDRHHPRGKPLGALFDDGSNIVPPGLVFMNLTTLEYAITARKSLEGLADVAEEFELQGLRKMLSDAQANTAMTNLEWGELQRSVAVAAGRVGKARFAQTFGKAVHRHSISPPAYIEAAIRAISTA